MGVLRACLRDYGITWKPTADYLCTVRIGRRVLPHMKHNLNVLCAHYGIALHHHQADSDSHACAEILLRYMESGVDVSQFVKQYRLIP
ncbi:MAG: exonuclease, partial [Oscillospiraceae bacterium]|nr:exonuclease [Oscillospiraceae bacterium]